MDQETLFEMAVRLVEANLRAGQFNDALNFDTIIRDQVEIAFNALSDTWVRLGQKDEVSH